MEATIHLQPSLPGTPLHTLSPDRINIQAQRTPVASMQQDLVSPAGPSLLSSGNLPDRLVRSHRRTGSDVQNKVAKFDGLTKESVERRKKDEAALKRAVLGREEAEDEVRLLKEEGRRYREAWEDERAKLERVVGRLEDVTVSGCSWSLGHEMSGSQNANGSLGRSPCCKGGFASYQVRAATNEGSTEPLTKSVRKGGSTGKEGCFQILVGIRQASRGIKGNEALPPSLAK
jgi:hypothetical protein